MIVWKNKEAMLNLGVFFEEGDILTLQPQSPSTGVVIYLPFFERMNSFDRMNSGWLREERALDGSYNEILLFGQFHHRMDFVFLKFLPETSAYFFRILTPNITLSNEIAIWINPLKTGFSFCDAYKNGQQFIKCNPKTAEEVFLTPAENPR